MIKIPDEAINKFSYNLQEIFDSGNIAEGKWNDKLVDYFKNYTGAACSTSFCSNGAGLLAILSILKTFRGYKDIFIQSNTMYGVKTIAITSGLRYVGAVSCSIPSLMPTLSQVKKFVSDLADPSHTVFLLSHIGGIVNPHIVEISSFCKEAGIALIEDCAHSLGATLNNSHTGLFGVAGVYSLYATKAIAAGEGGIAVTNDKDLGDKLNRFNIYDRFDRVQDIGVNFRVSEIQALFSLCMAELSEKIIENKSNIATKYIDACRSVGISYVDPFGNGQRGNHYKFTLIADRSSTAEFSLISNRTSPVYDYNLGLDPENISSRHICLPIWFGLEPWVVSDTVNQILKLKSLA